MNYLIVGCGRMGADLALALLNRGHAITLIDRDRETEESAEAVLRSRLITGNCFDREVLLRAGIEQVDGLAVTTSNDETNVIMARLARLVFRVPRVVARLHDPRKAEIYQRLEVQVAAPFSWAINRFVDLLSYSELDAVSSLGNGEVEIIRVEVPPLLEGKKVGMLTVPGEVRVIAISRSGRTLLPSPETILQRDDAVHLAVMRDSIQRLRAILGLG